MVAQNVVTRSAGQITAWEENILLFLLVWTHMLQYPICDVWTGFKENLFVFRSWPVLTWCYCKLPAPLYEWIAMNESTNFMSVNLPQMAHIVSVGYFHLCLGLTWRVGNFFRCIVKPFMAAIVKPVKLTESNRFALSVTTSIWSF